MKKFRSASVWIYFCAAFMRAPTLVCAQPTPRFADSPEVAAAARLILADSAALKKAAAQSGDPGAGLEAAAQDPQNQNAVLIGRQIYYIKNGFVFDRDLDTAKVSQVEDASLVTALVAFKGALVALRQTGSVWIKSPYTRWMFIGDSALSIAATDADLIAVTPAGFTSSNGEIWIYKGRPADEIPGFLSDAQPVAFYDSGVSGVTDTVPCLISGRRDVQIKFGSGQTAYFSQIKATLPTP